MGSFLNRAEIHEKHHDVATRRIRVEVHDIHGKLDPYAFQDWITALEDYFDWFGMTADRKVGFVRMKLKG